MAKEFKTSISVTLTDTDIQKQSRFLDDSITHTPLSHESGEANLPGGMVDHQIAASVNQIIIMSQFPFSLKIGDTTNPEYTNMKMFVYDGSSADVFVSNPGTDPIIIKYASAKYSVG
jgi:hypothetical protein